MSAKTMPPAWRAQNPAGGRTGPLFAANETSRDRSGVVSRTSNFEHFVRVDRHGRVLTGHGDVDQLAAFASYACRMADLVGELLELGPAVALETTYSGRSLFVYRDAGGETVGLKPHASMSLRHWRSRLKL